MSERLSIGTVLRRVIIHRRGRLTVFLVKQRVFLGFSYRQPADSRDIKSGALAWHAVELQGILVLVYYDRPGNSKTLPGTFAGTGTGGLEQAIHLVLKSFGRTGDARFHEIASHGGKQSNAIPSSASIQAML